VSNPIRYDSLLVRYLARTLAERLDGRACRTAPVRAGDRAALLVLDRGEALRFDLHPSRGDIRLVAHEPEVASPPDAEVRGARWFADERRFELRIHGGSRFRPVHRRLMVELQTNHGNLLLLDGDDRIVWALWPREAGGRSLRAGATYLPPPPRPRLDPAATDREAAWSAWEQVIRSTRAADRPREVQHRFAYLGPINVLPVLGGAAAEHPDAEASRAAFERWWRLASLPPADPVLLHLPRGPHPYPLPLEGVRSEPVADLLHAMAQAAEAVATAAAPEPKQAAPVAALERRLEQLRQRAQRLRDRLDQVGDAERERRFGDLLLAKLASVPRGVASVRLEDWDGAEVEIPLDPSLSGAENAARWYESARVHDRAAARIPPLLRAADREAARCEELLRAAREGEVDAKALAGFAAPTSQGRGAVPADGVRQVFRTYRTSGGLEVRVGRGSGDNDRLTFGHSRPEDIWLHARSVPGSHVILRWANAEHAPPARDLAEAAGLAAWFSKARTSGVVAVDWTRRKHVRKPRGAPPGQVVPQRVRTVFVEPDAGLERRLADEAELSG
jgi:predicted ribosome quality control (RQC) complex YloA/Tae2 family protein